MAANVWTAVATSFALVRRSLKTSGIRFGPKLSKQLIIAAIVCRSLGLPVTIRVLVRRRPRFSFRDESDCPVPSRNQRAHLRRGYRSGFIFDKYLLDQRRQLRGICPRQHVDVDSGGPSRSDDIDGLDDRRHQIEVLRRSQDDQAIASHFGSYANAIDHFSLRFRTEARIIAGEFEMYQAGWDRALQVMSCPQVIGHIAAAISSESVFRSLMMRDSAPSNQLLSIQKLPSKSSRPRLPALELSANSI